MLCSFFAILLQQAQAVWRTVTRTGTGIIVADDTTEGIPLTIEMQGWTKQEGKPSPEHPQEIVNEGVYNHETKKYERTIRVSNKNLFDKKIAENKENWTTGINYPYMPVLVGKGNKICVSYDADLQTGLGFYACISKQGGSSSSVYGWLYHSTAEGLIKKTLVFTAEQDYIFLSVSGATSSTQKFMNNIGDDLQIEISESPTAYVEHTEQSVKITSDRPVSHLDRLVVQDGQYGWLYGIGIFKATGNENWLFGNDMYYTGASTNMYTIVNELFETSSVDGAEFECKCDRLSYTISIWDSIDGSIGYSTNVKQIHFRFPNTLLGVADDATKEEKQAAYIAYIKKCAEEGNPVTVQYKLAEPEFVPLPEEEQAELKALKTYFPTTVFSNDQSLFMQVEYNTKVQEKEGE